MKLYETFGYLEGGTPVTIGNILDLGKSDLGIFFPYKSTEYGFYPKDSSLNYNSITSWYVQTPFNEKLPHKGYLEFKKYPEITKIFISHLFG